MLGNMITKQYKNINAKKKPSNHRPLILVLIQVTKFHHILLAHS